MRSRSRPSLRTELGTPSSRREAGEPFDPAGYDVAEQTDGGGGTAFGVPSAITALDRRPVTTVQGERLARIVEAAWSVFDHVAAAAPAELRKGPRGGGRDRDKMIGHVVESEWYYAREMGLRAPQPAPGRSRGDRGPPRVDARDPAPPVGRLAAGRPHVAAPLRGPADRLACPRPRLGDGGPDGSLPDRAVAIDR